MEKKVFFSENGLTSTSANHIANLAKEYIQNLEWDLKNIRFYNTYVKLLTSSEQSLLNEGIDSHILYEIESSLTKITEMKSLIAWIREAIKAKEALLKKVSDLTYTEFVVEHLNTQIRKFPEMKHVLTEEEYFDSLSIKERNRYYSLCTEAAVIGKYIHPEGSFALARKQLSEIMKNPRTVVGEGRDATMYVSTPSVNLGEVDEIFFKLQKRHREVQAQINSMRSDCSRAIEQDGIAASNEYEKELSAYRIEESELQRQFADYRATKTSEISSYKIAIPDSLKKIYEFVSKLGK